MSEQAEHRLSAEEKEILGLVRQLCEKNRTAILEIVREWVRITVTPKYASRGVRP